jgi:hypothetical protein
MTIFTKSLCSIVLTLIALPTFGENIIGFKLNKDFYDTNEEVFFTIELDNNPKGCGVEINHGNSIKSKQVARGKHPVFSLSYEYESTYQVVIKGTSVFSFAGIFKPCDINFIFNIIVDRAKSSKERGGNGNQGGGFLKMKVGEYF